MHKTVKYPLPRIWLRHEPRIDHTKHLTGLLTSIHEQVTDPLTIGQVKVIHDHLRYAIIVGFEISK